MLYDDQLGGISDAAVATRLHVAGSILPSSATPAMDGVAAAGSATTYARGDHAHPTDTSLAPLASPVFTGQPRSSTVTALGATGTVSLDPTLGQIFTCTPTGAIALNAASAPAGARVFLVVTTSGTSSFNITPGTNFKTAGALATGTSSGKVFVMEFVGDGTNLNEVSRTAAM